ncbi:MAG: lectin-like protein [Deltaproteobacteria bacterium]|nr:lectin-like protein [Deltaproteobacteria bacterium]
MSSRRHRALSLGLLAVLVASTAQAAVEAGPIRNPATGHDYYLLSPNTWAAAEAEANALGGNLVAILDAAENTWVWETFAPIHGGPLWIGLNDVEEEGTFVWTSGRPTAYTSWWVAGGQPSGDGNAVELNNYLWNDNSGSTVFRAVAEVVPPGPVTVQVDWSAEVDGSVGPGVLSGTFGTFEVASEGLVFPLPAGATLTASATGFSGVFSNQAYVLDLDVGGLAIRFDGLDPITTTLVSAESAENAIRYGYSVPCGGYGCRVILERYVTAGFDLVRAARFDYATHFENWSSGTPAYHYTVVPELGAEAGWIALAGLGALRAARRRRS